MAYKYVFNETPNHLIHFNKNHSKSNGQFISGDGDGDGVINDNKSSLNKVTQNVGTRKDLRKFHDNKVKGIEINNKDDVSDVKVVQGINYGLDAVVLATSGYNFYKGYQNQNYVQMVFGGAGVVAGVVWTGKDICDSVKLHKIEKELDG